MATHRIEDVFISFFDYIKRNRSYNNLNSIPEKYAFPDTGLGKFVSSPISKFTGTWEEQIRRHALC